MCASLFEVSMFAVVGWKFREALYFVEVDSDNYLAGFLLWV
jgi:hypothetical protein